MSAYRSRAPVHPVLRAACCVLLCAETPLPPRTAAAPARARPFFSCLLGYACLAFGSVLVPNRVPFPHSRALFPSFESPPPRTIPRHAHARLTSAPRTGHSRAPPARPLPLFPSTFSLASPPLNDPSLRDCALCLQEPQAAGREGARDAREKVRPRKAGGPF